MLLNNKNNAWFFQRLIRQSQSFETSHTTGKITKHTIKMTSSMAWKGLSRSLNKLLFVPLFCMKLFLFSNTIRTFLKQLFWWKPTWTRDQNTPWYKDITRSEQKLRWKMKAKRSSRKREHSLNDKSEKQSVFGKWKARELLQKKFVGVQPFIAAKKKLKTKVKTLQEKCIVHEAIKI
jgi:hypothetical protein